MKMKRIIVACGSGVATSQTVASKVQRLLNERKVDASVEAVDIKSIRTFIKMQMLMYLLLQDLKITVFLNLMVLNF